MADFQFDTNREPYVIVVPSHNYGYGHVSAHFMLPDPKNGYWDTRIELVLRCQINGPSADHRPLNPYAVRFEAEQVRLRNVKRLAQLAAKLEKLQPELEGDGDDGTAFWFTLFTAALTAWKADHVFVRESIRDSRVVPDLPYFTKLKNPANSHAALSCVGEVFKTLYRSM